jgi:outer membrane protein
MMFNKFIKYFFLIIFLFISNEAYSIEKIVHINISYIMNNSLAGKSIKKQIEDQNKKNITNFNKEEENLRKKKTKLTSQKNILNAEDYKKKVEEFKVEIKTFNTNKQKSINELNNKKINSQKTLIDNLIPILTSYSKENSISYILRKESLLIGKTELDITGVILKTLDTKIKKIELK